MHKNLCFQVIINDSYLVLKLSYIQLPPIIITSTKEFNLSTLKRITVDLGQCGGRPCIRHMRIRVKDILDLLASGASTEEILEDYPYLEAEDIKASLEYAAHQMDHPVLSVA